MKYILLVFPDDAELGFAEDTGMEFEDEPDGSAGAVETLVRAFFDPKMAACEVEPSHEVAEDNQFKVAFSFQIQGVIE